MPQISNISWLSISLMFLMTIFLLLIETTSMSNNLLTEKMKGMKNLLNISLLV